MKKIILAITLTLLATPILAHPGRLDANQGHMDKSTNQYHYHCNGFTAHLHPSGKCEHIELVINNKPIENAGVKSINSKTFVPLRFISEQLEATVSYEPTGKIITINDISFKLGEKSSLSIEGSTYVPLREIAELLNCTVTYENRVITVD